MQEITINQLHEFYLDTVNKFGTYLLQAEDELVDYYAFEEFNAGATTFLHQNTLLRLRAAGLINDEILQESLQLRQHYFALENSDNWNVAAFRTSEKWKALLKLTDHVNKLNLPQQ